MKKAGIWMGGILGTLLFVWIAMHFTLPTINPAQEAPEDHPPGACWACHMVLESAEIRE